MKTYVLGAGASHPVYPLGSGLLVAIDDYIKSSGKCFDRFQYDTEWPAALEWLRKSPNPLLSEAFRTQNIEQIFTVLDFVQNQYDESFVGILNADKLGAEEVAVATSSHQSFNSAVRQYSDVRRLLLWATEAYFQHHHEQDQAEFASAKWETLKKFAQILQPGDVVVTFNYDSTVERVLLDHQKWSPKDGYGTELVFQKNVYDNTPVNFASSPVKVLHLHGALGWYKKPHLVDGFLPDEEGGGIAADKLTPAPLETEISLDPLLLQTFGISAVDASMPSRPPTEYQSLLHPSFLKDYAGESTGNEIFRRMWKLASEAMRAAERVTIIGYSLPAADTAAWALLLTNCDQTKTETVDTNVAVMSRYRRLLRLPELKPARDFGSWLQTAQ